VRGYMTIGSPIDKHIVMWPELWLDFKGKEVPGWKRPTFEQNHRPIQWWNYYDYGTRSASNWIRRVFGCKTTVGWIQSSPPISNLSSSSRRARIAASRATYLPGEAHNEYWNDPGVFGHFISAVILERKNDKKKNPVPSGEFCPRIVSWVLPYVLAFLILTGGIYLIYRAVDPFLQMAPKMAPCRP